MIMMRSAREVLPAMNVGAPMMDQVVECAETGECYVEDMSAMMQGTYLLLVVVVVIDLPVFLHLCL